MVIFLVTVVVYLIVNMLYSLESRVPHVISTVVIYNCIENILALLGKIWLHFVGLGHAVAQLDNLNHLIGIFILGETDTLS